MTINPGLMLSGPFAADGSNKSWDFDYKVLGAGQIRIMTADNLLGVNPTFYDDDFSIDDQYINNDAGGVVVFPAAGTALAVGQYLWVLTAIGYHQDTAFTSQGPFSAEIVESALDFLSIQIKQLAREMTRTVRAPYGVSAPALNGEAEEDHLLVGGADNTVIFSDTTTEDLFAASADAVNAAALAQAAATAAQAALAAIVVPTYNVYQFAGPGPTFTVSKPILSPGAVEVFLNKEAVYPSELTIVGATVAITGVTLTSEDTVMIVERTALSIGKPSGGTVDDHSYDLTSRTGKQVVDAPNLLSAYGVVENAGDQTADLALLQAQADGFEIDFGGQYPQASWPTDIKVKNGGVMVKGTKIPGNDTFRVDSFRLTRSNAYDKWAQDKAHVLPRGVICVPYLTGSGHHSSDNVLVAKYSHDQGGSWSAKEFILRPETELQSTMTGSSNDRLTCMSAGCTLGGRQFFLWMSYETGSVHRHWLWHRKAPDERKFNGVVSVETFFGQGKLRFNFPAGVYHGYVAGDKVTFPALNAEGHDLVAGDSLHGLTLPSNSNVVVTSASDSYFEIAMTNTASVSDTVVLTNGTFQNGWGSMIKVEISSALQTAYLDFWPSLPAAGLPYLHGRVIADNGDILSFLSTANGAHLVRIASLYTPTITMTTMGFVGGEVTGVACGSNRYCGFTRGTDITGSSDGRSLFWRTTDNFATIVSEQVRPDDTKGGQVWDENTPLTVCNGYILAARCERTDDPLQTQPAQPASVRTYLWMVLVDDALNLGINAAPFAEIGRLHWSGAKSAQTSPGVGVGSWVTVTPPADAIDSAMSGQSPNYATAFYFCGGEIENQTGRDSDWNRGQIYGFRFTDLRQPQRATQDGAVSQVISGSDADVYQLANSELGTNFVATKGAYIGSPPSSPVDLTVSTDYKGGGIKLLKDNLGMVHCWGRLNWTGAADTEAIAFTLAGDLKRFCPAEDCEFFVTAGAATINRSSGTNVVIRILGSNNISSTDRGTVHVSRQASVGLAGALTDISFDGLVWLGDGDAR